MVGRTRDCRVQDTNASYSAPRKGKCATSNETIFDFVKYYKFPQEIFALMSNVRRRWRRNNGALEYLCAATHGCVVVCSKRTQTKRGWSPGYKETDNVWHERGPQRKLKRTPGAAVMINDHPHTDVAHRKTWP